MVYLHFPSKHTDEELMLQAKYQKLRKKKKALLEMKAPKPEPEKANPLKRPRDPKDAKEMAKKLILAGKVSIPAKSSDEKTSFKRSIVLSRKIQAAGATPAHPESRTSSNSSISKGAPVTFEPFTPQTDSSTEKGNRTSYGGTGARPFKSNYSSTHSKNISPDKRSKRGPTIYVHALNISETALRAAFSKFGAIVNLKVPSSSTAFLTFESVENAEVAITEMNGATYEDITFTSVEFARRQVNPQPNDPSGLWTNVAISQSQKGSHQDRRQLVTYDDPF